MAELADSEASQLRDRHKAREAAVRRYDAGRAAVAEAEVALASAKREQAEAMVALLGTGLDTSAVAAVLGVDARRVREARSAVRPAGDDQAVAVAGTTPAKKVG